MKGAFLVATRYTASASRDAASYFVADQHHTESPMEPTSIIMWAVCLGVAWLIFNGLTGADEWLKSLFGKSKVSDLEARVAKLEKRIDELK